MINPKSPKKGRSFGEMCPELVKQWHPTKNGDLTAFDVNAGSAFYAWWKCSKGDDHEWQSTVKNRKYGQGCGVCSGKVVVKSNCLSSNYPNIAKEWHPIKNKPLTPSIITMYSDKQIWWKCKEGDEFQTSVVHRTKDKTNCPYCTNQKVRDNGDNSHAAIYPESALEWDNKKNYPLRPEEITPSARKKYWWKCQCCNSSYKQSPYQRTNGSRCRKCGIESTKQKLQQGDKFIKNAKERCEKEGYLFKGVIGEYKNVESKFRYTCKEGHEKEVTFHGFVLSNSRCPECAVYGYKDSKSAIFYVNYNKEMIALKFGKTNQLDGNRLAMQNRKLHGKPKWVEKFKTSILSGKQVSEIEYKIKQMFKPHVGFLSKEEMPDGFTETIKYSEESFNKIKSIVDEVLTEKAEKKP